MWRRGAGLTLCWGDVQVWHHPESTKLFCEEIDVGEGVSPHPLRHPDDGRESVWGGYLEGRSIQIGEAPLIPRQAGEGVDFA
jgi:hypothetical protein